MFKVDNEKELLELLKIISQESVKKSRKSLKEEIDPLSANFEDKLKKEKETLYEQEEDEEIDNEVPEEEPLVDDDSAELEPPSEPEKTKAKDSSEDSDVPKDLGSSLDSLERNINSLRAGKSLKDSTIRQQLEVYYDRLAEEERDVLVLFIRQLSDILSGDTDGDEAMDPSDPPLNISFVVGGNKEEAEEEAEEDSNALAQEDEEQLPDADEDEDEDTTPPIKVNESQDLRKIRNKIRKLMRS